MGTNVMGMAAKLPTEKEKESQRKKRRRKENLEGLLTST